MDLLINKPIKYKVFSIENLAESRKNSFFGHKSIV